MLYMYVCIGRLVRSYYIATKINYSGLYKWDLYYVQPNKYTRQVSLCSVLRGLPYTERIASRRCPPVPRRCLVRRSPIFFLNFKTSKYAYLQMPGDMSYQLLETEGVLMSRIIGKRGIFYIVHTCSIVFDRQWQSARLPPANYYAQQALNSIFILSFFKLLTICL